MADARLRTRIVVLPFAAALGWACAAVAQVPARGVAVERVRPALLGATAGVQPGDIFLSWSRPPGAAGELPVGGSFESTFDVTRVEIEEAPRGTVRIVALREGREVSLTMPIWRWGIGVRPVLPPRDIPAYEEARSCFDEKLPDLGWSLLAELAEGSAARGNHGVAAWFFASAGESLAGSGRLDAAEEAFWRASLEAEREAGGEVLAAVWTAAGIAFAGREAFEAALECYSRAQGALGPSVGVELRMASLLSSRATVLWSLGKLEESLEDDRMSLSLRRSVVPGSVLVAASLNNVGLSLRSLGDLSGAQAHYQEALVLFERDMPGSAVHATLLGNLGTVAWMRGDLAAAEAYDLKALAIRERVAPESFELARSWNNLGALARSRRDPDTAERYYKKALDLAEKLKPQSLETGSILGNLSQVADDRGDLEGALDYAARALVMQEKVAPRSMELARTLTSMASLHLTKGDLEASQRSNEAALALKQQETMGSLSSTWNHMIRGQIALGRKDYGAADSAFSTALDIRSRIAPGSTEESEVLFELGKLHVLRGEPGEAESYFEKALGALEAQRGKLGGGEEVARGFAAHFSDLYRDLAALQVRRGEFDRAFFTLERFRAKSLLTMLAERDLDLSRDASQELLLAMRRSDSEYDRVQGDLAGLNPEKDAGPIAELSERLAEIRVVRSRIAEEVRRSSPRLGSLRYPVPLDRVRAGKALPKGCLFISLCTCADEVLVLALLDGHLEAYRVPWERARLTREVGIFRRLASDPSGDMGELHRRGAALFEKLLGPAVGLWRRAKSLAICPDGPLHALPWAALRHGRRYVVEEKALFKVLSATVYAETTPPSSPAAAREVEVVAFGDPDYGGGRGPVPAMHPSSDSPVGSLSPLPATRGEVEAVGALFAPRARLFLGGEATETRAKVAGADASFVHFACHGFSDEKFPLDSGLALSTPGADIPGDNGYLQAWEVFETVRLNADLVVLSACDTAMGREMGGEGLMGLTRAFQYAGARCVLSSLWSVADRSTAILMARFYSHLRSGMTPAKCMQKAQVEMIRSVPQRGRGDRPPEPAGESHPFHWSCFILEGRGV